MGPADKAAFLCVCVASRRLTSQYNSIVLIRELFIHNWRLYLTDTAQEKQDSTKEVRKETWFHRRSDGLVLVVLLQIARAIQYVALYVVIEASYSRLPPGLQVYRPASWPILIPVFIDLGLAILCWKRSRVAWGITLGIGFLHIVFLNIWYLVLKTLIVGLTLSEILLLLTPNVRSEFIVSAIHRHEGGEQVCFQPQVYWAVIVTQAIKAILVTIGGILLLSVYGFFEPPFYDSNVLLLSIPHVPMALFMGGIGFVAAFGLSKFKKWAYDITLALAILGIFEATVSSLILVFYISVGLVILMLTPQAKTVFG